MLQLMSQSIEARKDEFAKLIVDTQWLRHPRLHLCYGEQGHNKCVQDVKYTLCYLSQAIANDSPTLFVIYIEWLSGLFKGINIPTEELSESLEITSQLLQNALPEHAKIIDDFIGLALQQLNTAVLTPPSFINDPANPALSELCQNYLNTLLHRNRAESSQLILDAVASGITVKDIYLHVFQACQYEIGHLWHMNQMTIAQEHYCTAVTQLIMSQLYVHIFNTSKNGRKLVATCVGGELHEIGMRMVADFFEMEGWDTYYLGSNMPTSGIVKAVLDYKPDVLAISATMVFHIPQVQELIEKIRSTDAVKTIKILTGGYPFNIEANLWRQVGADGYAFNAEQAIKIANSLL